MHTFYSIYKGLSNYLYIMYILTNFLSWQLQDTGTIIILILQMRKLNMFVEPMQERMESYHMKLNGGPWDNSSNSEDLGIWGLERYLGVMEAGAGGAQVFWIPSVTQCPTYTMSQGPLLFYGLASDNSALSFFWF